MNQNGKKYRILCCSTALTFGGEQKQLLQILQHLDRQHFEIILCSIRPFGYLDEAIQKSGIPLLCLKIPNPYDPRAIWSLRRVIKQHDIDLLHMGIFGANFHGILAAMSIGKPIVAILQSMFELSARASASESASIAWRLKWHILYAGYGVLSRIAKIHFVALSEAVKKSAIKELHLPAKHISVVPLGLTPEEYEKRKFTEILPKIKTELQLEQAYPILLNVARLTLVKGQSELLQAMSRIRKHFPNSRLLIAGDGLLLPELEKLRNQLDLRTEVLLLGRRDDIQALLHMSNLFVFSSYYEGLPGAVIEAMAAGKCVVAFDIPALREIIKDGHSGILVKGRNFDQFAEVIIWLAEHPKIAQEMGEKAQQIVRMKFDIRQNVKSLEAVYKKMLNGFPITL